MWKMKSEKSSFQFYYHVHKLQRPAEKDIKHAYCFYFEHISTTELGCVISK